MVASRLFAAEGAMVVLTDLADDAGEAVAAEIRSSGGDAAYVHADVAREMDAELMIRTAVDTFGRLDVLYNNAGIMLGDDGSVTSTDETVWDRTLAINVKGVAFGCKYGIPAMVASGGARSSTSRLSSPGWAPRRRRRRTPPRRGPCFP